MSDFSKLVPDGDRSGTRYMRAGAGAPVVVLQTDEAFGPTPVYDLLAAQCEVTLAAPAEPGPFTADGVAELTRALGYARCSIVCEPASATAGLDHALSRPQTVDRLVLKAPRLGRVDDAYARIEVPVLVLESSRVSDDRAAGQKLAAVIPDCYHVFVYDASEALSGDRPEAVADVVGDFVERGGRFIVSKPMGVLYP